ncbi:hypothetical protein CQW23_13184 [Capsicum baccatum]|uniref:KIB1-4 beta-propeller domain-containing protein n=1 Tax=Capsicum baccatum TaxID=33114 RepID=A0A2G2WUP5_CAPBA|nr:hypothetical protein CQW23_13184 [Capsicum baccatum]
MAVANWAELSKDLSDVIVKRVKLIEDFIAFIVVCTSWRNSATKANFDFLSPQLPLLMLADKEKELWALAEEDFPDPELRMRYLCMRRAVLSVSPSVMSDYVLAVSYYANYSFLACWRPGDLNWTFVERGHCGGISSMIFTFKDNFKVLLMVEKFGLLAFEVLAFLNQDVNKAELKEVNTLGDYAIFVGLNGASCIDSAKFTGVWSNHIYFTDDDCERFHYGDGGGRNMGVYNLEDGKVESFYPGESPSHICSPTWVTPSF